MSLFGWPSCATQGCPWPGLFKVEMENEAGALWAHLCFLCITSAPNTLKSLSEMGESQRKLLQDPLPEDLPKTEIMGIRNQESSL